MAGTYPDSQVPRARSARQQFWLDHLRAWQTQGTSLRAYAAANGLSSSSLYRMHPVSTAFYSPSEDVEVIC